MSEGGFRARPRWLPPLLAVVVVFAGLTLLRRALAPPEPEALAARPALLLPDMLGCWELHVGAWQSGVETEAQSGAPADSAARALLAAPDRVLLLPDSIDEWRREFTTYRAVPVAGAFDPRLRGILRWFLRADTLWLVWSDRTVRAGLALRSQDGRLAGAGRALVASPGGEPSLDARAGVTAWKVNCATGLREVERAGPRP